MWCDNLDNDCDGETDELFLDGGLISYTDLSGATGLWKGDACGVGACGGGLVLCNDARTGLTCSTVGDVSAETCNGADDDCNGVIDNGFNLSTDEANCGACGVTAPCPVTRNVQMASASQAATLSGEIAPTRMMVVRPS